MISIPGGPVITSNGNSKTRTRGNGEFPRVPLLEDSMSRNQINVKLSDRHMRLLEELAEQYGTISSAVRIALEMLYRDTFPERSGAVPEPETVEETVPSLGRK